MTINTSDIKAGMTLGEADALLLREHIDAQAARIAELEKVLNGLSPDAIAGGWTAAGISEYAKLLEKELAELRKSPAPAAVPDDVRREFVNQLRDTAIKYSGAQCLRDVLSRQIAEFVRLNSGSKSDD